MKNLLNLFKNKKQVNTQVEPERIEVVDNFEIDDPALIYIDDNHCALGVIKHYSIDGSDIGVKCGDDECDIVWGNPTNIFVKPDELYEFNKMNIMYDIESMILYEDTVNDILFDNVCILRAIDGKHKLMIMYKEPKLFTGNGIVARVFNYEQKLRY